MTRKAKASKVDTPERSTASIDVTRGRKQDFEAHMSLAEEIMQEDRDVLRVLSEVMTRRRRALRKLSE